MAKKRHYRMVGEESARQKREREERIARVKEEAMRRARERKVALWCWRVVLAVCCIGWLAFGLNVGLSWYHLLWSMPVGGVLSFALIWMLYDFAKTVASGDDNDHYSGGSSSSGVEWGMLAILVHAWQTEEPDAQGE